MNCYLNPCPICGGKAKIECISVGYDVNRYCKKFMIVCTECKLSTDEFGASTTISDTGIVSASTKAVADNIKKWNNRSGINITEDGWIPIKTIKMTEDEKKEFKIKYEVDADERYACPLPENGQTVLITTMWDSVLLDTFHNDGEGVYFNDYDGFTDIKAWKALPEPYKESEKNELSTMEKEI